MNYNEALYYIHSISNFFCNPGLERISVLCEKMGNPQNNLKFVHIAGTNGKGSFCAMISSVLKEAGYKTGVYTSPYILNFNERIAINGVSISNNELCELTEYVKIFADQMDDKPTEFELITAMAFEYFKRKQCDIVVLECGMGGRFDATNIINNSLLSVITGISIDHTSFLGNTIELIAAEKAGIIKEKGTCLWCGNDQIAENVIKNECVAKSAQLIKVNRDSLTIKDYTLNGTIFDFYGFKNIKLSLLGNFQPINATNVITAVQFLCSNGFNISETDIRRGIEKTVWKARFEVISLKPLIIADGGHNREGVLSAIESIKLYFKNQKVNIITGVMKDKDYNYIAKTISQIADNVFCVTPDNIRALPAKEYAEIFNQYNVSAVVCNSVKDALKKAKLQSSISEKPIITLGSLYMYKEILESL